MHAGTPDANAARPDTPGAWPASLRGPDDSPCFTREAVRALDRAASEELGVPTLLLMENAAQAIEAALDWWFRARADRDPGALLPGVLAVCGPGNNGGDGLALARRLHVRGLNARVLLATPASALRGDAATNLRVARAMGVAIAELEHGRADAGAVLERAVRDLRAPLVLVDALFGTGLDRPITGALADLIVAMNRARATGAVRTLAVDAPSGLDVMTGQPVRGEGGAVSACVEADLTVTLAGMKPGLRLAAAKQWAGEVVVGSIGLPDSFMRRFAMPR